MLENAAGTPAGPATPPSAEPSGGAGARLAAGSDPVAVVCCDEGGRVTVVAGRTELLPFSAGSTGRSYREVFAGEPALLALAARAAGGESLEQVACIVAGRRLETWFHPLPTRGPTAGFVAVLLEATGRLADRGLAEDAERRQAALVEHASDVIVVFSADRIVRYVNPACQRVLGYRWRVGERVELLELVHPDDRERCRSVIEQVRLHPGLKPHVSLRLAHHDGGWRVVEVIADNLLSDPAVAGVVVTIRDVTAHHEAESRLRANAERQAALADLGRWALAGVDYANLLEDSVRLLQKELGVEMVHVFEAFPESELLALVARTGPPLPEGELISSEPTSSPASFAVSCQQTVVSEDLASEERFDVPSFWSVPGARSIIVAPIPGQDMAVGVVGVASLARRHFRPEDVALVDSVANVLAATKARARAEEAIRLQGLRDPLTGLPNRLQLAAHAPTAATTDLRRNPLLGADRSVFVVDLDRFKEINTTLGHAVGDLVLLEVARRLERLGKPVELVARLGGDEFAVVCRALTSEEEENAFAHRLVSLIGEPLSANGVNLRLRTSVGIASVEPTRDGELTVPDLLRRAEIALSQAKREHGGVRRYVDETERSSLSRLALASELAEAIDHGHLRLEYQPKVGARDGKPTGVEALVRWQHPSRGLLAPDVFVPLAEQTGLVRELTSWVLARALAECGSWQRAGWRLPVAVNLSAVTVHDPTLLGAVMTAITRSGLSPESIELEITESAVMLDPEGAIGTLNDLTSRGVRFSLDDFGTGYSSLAYLQRLPVTSVKIDKSFVRPLGEDPVARTIVRAVVELGHSLDMSVVAEGVDSAEAQAVLTALDCDILQGFHVARPMEASALRAWMASREGELHLPPGRPG